MGGWENQPLGMKGALYSPADPKEKKNEIPWSWNNQDDTEQHNEICKGIHKASICSR